MLTIPMLTIFLFVASAFAIPFPIRQRRAGHYKSRPLQTIETKDVSNTTNTNTPQYSYNWAGAVWNRSPGTFKSITGTLVVPTPQAPNGSASVWVGIDGNTCPGAILQTGIDVHYVNGEAFYGAWYEWFPDTSHSFDDIVIKAGDTVQMTVVATNTTHGVATVSNLSNSQSVSKHLTSSYALCGQNAEWIVEDYSQNDSLVPFCNFGSVKFENASATMKSGATLTTKDAMIIDLVQGNRTLASATTAVDGVTIRYLS